MSILRMLKGWESSSIWTTVQIDLYVYPELSWCFLQCRGRRNFPKLLLGSSYDFLGVGGNFKVTLQKFLLMSIGGWGTMPSVRKHRERASPSLWSEISMTTLPSFYFCWSKIIAFHLTNWSHYFQWSPQVKIFFSSCICWFNNNEKIVLYILFSTS